MGGNESKERGGNEDVIGELFTPFAQCCGPVSSAGTNQYHPISTRSTLPLPFLIVDVLGPFLRRREQLTNHCDILGSSANPQSLMAKRRNRHEGADDMERQLHVGLARRPDITNSISKVWGWRWCFPV